MATLTITTLPGTNDYDGTAAVTPSSLDTGGDVFECTGYEFIRLENTGTPARTVDIQTVADSLGRMYHGVGTTGVAQVSLGSNQVKYIGPFSRAGWMDNNGQIAVDVSGTGVNAEVVRFPASHRA